MAVRLPATRLIRHVVTAWKGGWKLEGKAVKSAKP